MRKKPIVAIIYDFDGTSRLSPTRRPHHCPLSHLLSCAHHIQVPYEEGQPRLGGVQPRRTWPAHGLGKWEVPAGYKFSR